MSDKQKQNHLPRSPGRPKGSKNRISGKKSGNYKVDKFLRTITPEQQDEIFSLLRFRPSYAEIHQVLKDRGYDGGICSVMSWYHSRFPTGDKAKEINQLALAAQNVNVSDVLQLSLVRVIGVVSTVMARIETGDILNQMDGAEAVKLLPALNREVRALAAGLQEMNYLSDRKQVELAGATMMAETLEAIFQDDPNMLEALQVGIRAALEKIESS